MTESPPRDFIHDSLAMAIANTLDADFVLIALGAHEQAIAHRIAVYLEPLFPGFQTDCEYNKDRHDIKRRAAIGAANEAVIRPDIIVHRRNSQENVLAVELKVRDRMATMGDLEKLRNLATGERYLYKSAAFVCVRNTPKQMKEGILTASISWLDSEGGTSPTPITSLDVRCNKHSQDVRAIVVNRKKAFSRCLC